MNSQSIAAMRPKIWQKQLYADVIDGLYFTENGLMGTDKNNIIQIKTDLMKEAGDTITFGLTYKLDGDGVDGDAELEGNEEEIEAYSDSISITQKRNAVRLKGKLDEKINAYNMRTDAKDHLKTWLQELIERQIFLKLGGVRNTTLVDVNGRAYSTACLWSNSPAVIPAADENAGYGNRYLCANYTAGTTQLQSTHIMTPALITRAKTKAKLARPKILPLRINGKDHYVMFLHPWQANDLKNNAVFMSAQRDAGVRGDENKIFTGALGVWDNVILFEHEYVPFLDISVAGYSFAGAATGTQANVDVFRALLCGRQAASFAQCKYDNGWEEKTFDYGNKVGFSTGVIGGIQKTTFNSLEYGVIAVDTAAGNYA